VDTYQFNIASNSDDETLYSVDKNTYDFAPALAGITLEPGTSIAAGAMYWPDAAGDEWPVGCGTVKAYPEGSATETGVIRYFGDGGLPTTLENQPNINPLNGYYIAANMDPGPVVTKGFDPAGNQIGETRFMTFEDAISISNIYDNDSTANPGCE